MLARQDCKVLLSSAIKEYRKEFAEDNFYGIFLDPSGSDISRTYAWSLNWATLLCVIRQFRVQYRGIFFPGVKF